NIIVGLGFNNGHVHVSGAFAKRYLKQYLIQIEILCENDILWSKCAAPKLDNS
ncbi:hypothetical protein ACJX0J_008623, partial [Zea mays]